jgi:hypothetical protein
MAKERINWDLLLNQKFNKLTIIKILGHNSKGKKLCNAVCECGVIKEYIAGNIKSNISKSCGTCPTEDMIGKQFGPYKVINLLGLKPLGKFNQFFWEVKCNYGHIKEYSTCELKKVRHPACLKCKQTENAIKWYYSRYRYDAKNKQRAFKLEFTDFCNIISKNCHYCGAIPRKIVIKGATPLLLNGVDRVDSKYDYIKNNVVPCCTTCNRMKMNLESKDFLNHINKISEYNFGWMSSSHIHDTLFK